MNNIKVLNLMSELLFTDVLYQVVKEMDILQANICHTEGNFFFTGISTHIILKV